MDELDQYIRDKFQETDMEEYYHLIDTAVFTGTFDEYMEISKEGCLGTIGVS